jgi:hypothetical protein
LGIKNSSEVALNSRETFMQDNRQIKRWQINWQTKIKLEGAEGFTNCSIHDINLKGVRICLPHKIQVDTFLRLSIVLYEDCVLQDIEVWVAWHKAINNNNFYGLYFTKIDDASKEKIYQFMRRNFKEQMNSQLWKGLGDDKKGGEDMEDRRIFQRFPVNLPMSFLDLNSGVECQASAQDISAKGIGMVVPEEIQPKTPLEMWLKVPDAGEPLYLRGEVVWSSKGDNEYHTGISLDKADLMGLSRVLRLNN